MKRELYDEICRVLTEYEHPEESEVDGEIDWNTTFYNLLVKIQNSSEYA